MKPREQEPELAFVHTLMQSRELDLSTKNSISNQQPTSFHRIL